MNASADQQERVPGICPRCGAWIAVGKGSHGFRTYRPCGCHATAIAGQRGHDVHGCRDCGWEVLTPPCSDPSKVAKAYQ